MNQQPSRRRIDPAFVVDVIQAVIAVVAAIVLALDSTGLLDLPWLQERLSELTFIAVCALIVTSVFDRRFTLQSQNRDMKEGFHDIDTKLRQIRDGMSGYLSADLLLKDRTNYTTPLEVRIQDAKEVCISGKSLVGFVTGHKSLIAKHARRGCDFRVIVNDPNLREKDRKEIEQTLDYLTEMQQDNLTTGRIEVRLTTAILSCSILMIDASPNSGAINVEYYAYRTATSDRPNLSLSPIREPKWYEFYRLQFETLWDFGVPYSPMDALETTN